MTNIGYVVFAMVAIGIGSYLSIKSDNCFLAYALGLVIGSLAVLIEIAKDGGFQFQDFLNEGG